MERLTDIYADRQFYRYLDIRIAQLAQEEGMTPHQYMDYIMIPYGYSDRRYSGK